MTMSRQCQICSDWSIQNFPIERNMSHIPCIICESHVRKIEQVKLNLSSREQVISMLHCHLKKIENNYSKLIEEFETLRFKHSNALQDNISLKEIHSKLQLDNHNNCLYYENSINYLIETLSSEQIQLIVDSATMAQNDDTKSTIKKFEECCCQVMDQLDQAHQSNQMLQETLSIITNENKNNLETIAYLNTRLNETMMQYNQDMETTIKKLNACEQLTENQREQIKTISESKQKSDSEVLKLEERVKMATKELSELRNCECESDRLLQDQPIASLTMDNEKLSSNLNQCHHTAMEELADNLLQTCSDLQVLVCDNPVCQHERVATEQMLQQHNEELLQIESVAKELETIRDTVSKQTAQYEAKIAQLENEKRDMERKIASNISRCDQRQEECDRLKAELTKKQYMIIELEKSIDAFNQTISNFDTIADELTCENNNLKVEREKLLNDLTVAETKLYTTATKASIEPDDVCPVKEKCIENADKLLTSNRSKRQNGLRLQLNEFKKSNEELKQLFERTFQENHRLRQELQYCTEQIQKDINNNQRLQMEHCQPNSKQNKSQTTDDDDDDDLTRIQLKGSLVKLKRQCQKCKKRCQISREYKEMRKHNNNTTDINRLRQKLRESTKQVMALKEDLHKAVTESNQLRIAIDSLIEKLERKLRGGNNSVEELGPKKSCDCMSAITSQYYSNKGNNDEDDTYLFIEDGSAQNIANNKDYPSYCNNLSYQSLTTTDSELN